MASIRDRIVAAMIAALNTGTPVGVPQAERTRLADLQPEDLPAITVFPARDTAQQVGGQAGPLYRSTLTVVVECRAKGSGSQRPDEAVDPLYVWAVKALVGKRLPDGAGGFLNHDTEEGDTTFAYEQGQHPYCLAAVEMAVSYQRLTADPEARV